MNIQHLAEGVRDHFTSKVILPVNWPQLDHIVEHWFARHSSTFHATTDILPCLTCTAVGGSAATAIPISSFWLSYFLASKIFDSVQDEDEHDQPWMATGAKDAISLGLAMIAAGNTALSFAEQTPALAEISREFGRTWTLAAKSQTDSQNDLSLERYFHNIIASTGEIFATAAWAGARMATDEKPQLEAVRNFGLYTGIRLAILSDCRGLKADNPNKPSDIAVGAYKLPVIYAMSLAEHPHHSELSKMLHGGKLSAAHTNRVLSILREMHAHTWSMGIADRYRTKAIAELQCFEPARVHHLIHYAS